MHHCKGCLGYIISRTITKFKHKRVDSANITSSNWQSENGIFYIQVFPLSFSLSSSNSNSFFPSSSSFVSFKFFCAFLSLTPSLCTDEKQKISWNSMKQNFYSLFTICWKIHLGYWICSSHCECFGSNSKILPNGVQLRRKRFDNALIAFIFPNCKYPAHILHHHR